jgi:hypothetical protein
LNVWGQLPAQHRRWIVINALIVTIFVNLVLNAAISWLSTRNQDEVKLWGTPLVETSTFWDVVGTLFILCLITTLVITTVIRREIREGRLEPLRLPDSPRWLASMPRTRLRRGVLIGAVCTAVLGPPLVFALILSDFPDLTTGEFVVYKTVFSVVLGIVVTPIIALCAMAEAPAPESAQPAK